MANVSVSTGGSGPVIRIRFERKNKEKFDFTYRAFKSFDGQGVSVGIHPDKNRRKEGGLTNTEVAIIHEYGDKKNPERSFVRRTLARRAPARLALNKLFMDGVPDVLRGKMTAKQLNEDMGKMMVAAVRKTIDNDVPPPNRPSTVRQKGNALTLRETFQMYNALDYKVR